MKKKKSCNNFIGIGALVTFALAADAVSAAVAHFGRGRRRRRIDGSAVFFAAGGHIVDGTFAVDAGATFPALTNAALQLATARTFRRNFVCLLHIQIIINFN